ncbi:General transcription factor II-I repeat domain-containing protein 2A-like [Oopsacas minuta]|uniref:General transcription factor II-I repeat domain-containing protein 2A-like n=1 Tax=Oopsacas minuta TaxID=111878 RepID=A0AAV7JE05_9METZ|nr:General transcription factor II-I repeat domain-containing protein 2A-like [Oopsacas minuta]
MSPPVIKAKKRKNDSECRVFKSSWTLDFFVVKHNEYLLCLICQEKIAVFKEYNIKRHYSTKDADTFDTLTSQVRIDRVNLLKDSINSQQSFFKADKLSSETATISAF